MRKIKFGNVEVTRLVTGGNPFSGFSHQGPARDQEMAHYYSTANVKAALHKAEAAGINTFFGRTDRHVQRLMLEYWDEGGKIQWFGQTASELPDQIAAIRQAAKAGAKGVYMHGGIADYWYAQKKFDLLKAALETMREVGVVAGFAGHPVAAHKWILDNLKPDFQMCSYYDPSPRGENPQHVSTLEEKWEDGHRDEMCALIQTIPWPVVHYKVFAGGNKPIKAGWEYLAKQMRKNDLVCIGHYLKENANMMAENVATFDRLVEKQ
jgi:hypothetical protein